MVQQITSLANLGAYQQYPRFCHTTHSPARCLQPPRRGLPTAPGRLFEAESPLSPRGSQHEDATLYNPHVPRSEDLHSARIPIAARVRTDFFVVLCFSKDGCREHFLNDGLDLSDQSGLLSHKIIKKSLVVLIFCTDCFAQLFDAPFRPGRFLFQEAQIVLSPSSGLNGPVVDFTVLEVVCDVVARTPNHQNQIR